MRNAVTRLVGISIVLALVGVPAAAQSSETVAHGSTRLFVMPTGRTLPGGSGYFHVISLGVAQLQVGAGDWFSIGGGTLSVVFGGDRPVWLTPKVALARSEHVNAAAGTVHYFASGSSGGFSFGVLTLDRQATSVTVGVMQGYGDIPAEARALLLGIERRKSEHTHLVAEATVFRGGALVIAGVRRVHKRFASDFGMAVPLGTEGPLVAFPVVNFGWRF